MDLIQCMRVFVALTDAGSFTTTAEQLRLSAPQVSRAVTWLENHLGTRLLNRTTRSMALTEAGEQYRIRTREILHALDASEREAKGSVLHPRGRLRVHCSASLANHFVIPLAAQFQARYNNVSVDLTLAPKMPDLIRDGYDVALVAMDSLRSSDLIAISVGRMDSILCAAPAYIAEHGLPQVPAALEQHRCLQLVAPAYEDRIWKFESEKGCEIVTLDPAFTVDVGASLAIAVKAGMGIGLLPHFVVADDLQSGALVRVLPRYRLNSIEVFLVYASRRYLDAKIRAWIDFMKTQLRLALSASSPRETASPRLRHSARDLTETS